jgi:hypothetical protein
MPVSTLLGGVRDQEADGEICKGPDYESTDRTILWKRRLDKSDFAGMNTADWLDPHLQLCESKLLADSEVGD